MFTGLAAGMGTITALERRGGQMRLGVRALFDLPAIALGESIAVNGVCLTVESAKENAFSAYASAETMAKTNLGALDNGSRVNLERALALGDRLGGHLVSGHVDCLARVDSVSPAGESVRFTLSFPKEFGVYVVEKGSVCLDGISLTVNGCGEDWLDVNIIPATQKETTISGWSPGAAVNMECDIIGKYVARMLAPHKGAARPSSITDDFLKMHGF
jgi:riboflavin synthase